MQEIITLYRDAAERTRHYRQFRGHPKAMIYSREAASVGLDLYYIRKFRYIMDMDEPTGGM